MMNPLLTRLHAYPFERLAHLLSDAHPPPGLTPIRMSVGEPQHEAPANVLATLRENLQRLGTYPTTAGVPELRAACAHWLQRRYRLRDGSVDPATMVLPVNGTREALFSFVQAAVDGRGDPLVLMPNPFYQIYEGAELLAGAQPHFLETTAANGFTPDLDGCRRASGGAVRCCFSAAPGTRPAACCRSSSCATRSGWPTGTTSSSRPTSAIPRSTWTSAPLPRDCCRPARPPGASASSAAWCSTASPSARAFPA